jgi:DNA polymerase
MGDIGIVEILYDSVPMVLSEIVRTAFIPKPGRKFIVADFSAIEARVLSWLAKEHWRNEVFAGDGKIYEAAAAKMFWVPIAKITKDSPLREKGKLATLACGYGGSVRALKAMGALEMGLEECELRRLVDSWRRANSNIVMCWREVGKAAMSAVREREHTATHGVQFRVRSGVLFITLPSGRCLSYVKPRVGINRFGSDAITYEGVDNSKKWGRIETYGAKIVENVVQGIARDILAFAMQTLRHCDIVFHVHDEIVIEANENMSVEAVCQQMGRTPPWAKGLLLRAEGFECDFYKKL